MKIARRRLVECAFLIPLRRDKHLSDGLPHQRKAWQWLRQRLFDFRGATRALELYEGWYLDPDTRQSMTDRSRRYVVALTRPELRKLRALLRQACGVFAQKCIYLSIAGIVEFVERPRK